MPHWPVFAMAVVLGFITEAKDNMEEEDAQDS
jgi:hypothetical protein